VIISEALDKLQELLKDFIPVVSRIDSNVSSIERKISRSGRIVDGIYKDCR